MTRVIAVIRYLILLVILYLLYLFNNHAVTLMLLVVALIVPILSFLCFFLSCKKIVFGISFLDAVVNREEPTAVVLSANNKSIIHQHENMNKNENEKSFVVGIPGDWNSRRSPEPV